MSNSKSDSESEVERLQKLLFDKLFHASMNGDFEIVKGLIKLGADVNRSRPEDGATSLIIASAIGHLAVVRLFIKSNADINLADNNGITPLIIASQNGHLEVVRFLVLSNADINNAGNHGCTPLYVASGNGHIGVVNLLLRNNAEVNIVNSFGETSLHCACYASHLDVVMALIDAKANLFLKDIDGDTPLDYAKTDEIRQYIINNPWYRRRKLIVMRPHNDHLSNKNHRMTSLGWLVTAKETGDGEDVELFHLKRVVASFL